MLAMKARMAAGGSSSPSVVGWKTDYSASASSHVISLTSLSGDITSPQTGNLVLVAAAHNSTGGTYNWSTTTPGFTRLFQLRSSDSNDTNIVLFYKVMDGSPDSSITILPGTTEDINVAVYVIKNQNAASVFDVTEVTATGTNSGIPDAPSIAPVTDGCLIIAVGGCAGSGTLANLTAPAGFDDLVRTGGTFLELALCSSLQTSASAIDPAAFGGGSSDASNSWAAATLAIRPR